MTILLYFRFILGIIFLLLALGFFIIEVMGVFKMKYIMNRMHSAAIGDAMALGLAIIGLVIINGINFTTFKLLLIPCFLFLSSPVSSHLIARLEVETTTKSNMFTKCDVRDLDEKGEQ